MPVWLGAGHHQRGLRQLRDNAAAGKFHEQHPGILVELIADDRRLDLADGEADIAARGGSSPEGAGIVARRLPHVAWSVYCNRAYAEEHGVPATLQALDGHAVVGAEGAMANLPGPLWLARSAPNSKISARSNSLTNLVAALKAGLGIATLPCLVGRRRSGSRALSATGRRARCRILAGRPRGREIRAARPRLR